MKKMAYVFGAVLSLSVLVSAEEMAVTNTPASDSMNAVAPSIEVVMSDLGSGVDRETRSIQGAASSFDPSVEVHYLTRVKAAMVPATVNHVYSVDGKEVASVSLAVKGSPWTTWSRKTVWPGAWKVELKDESGVVIESKEFSVDSAMMKSTEESVVSPASSPAQPQ